MIGPRRSCAGEPQTVTLWHMRRALIGCGVLAGLALGPMTFAVASPRGARTATRRDARTTHKKTTCLVP